MLSQMTRLNSSIGNPTWNPCKSSLQFTPPSSNANSYLIGEVEERKMERHVWNEAGNRPFIANTILLKHKSPLTWNNNCLEVEQL